MHVDSAADADAAAYPEDPLLAADQMRKATLRLREELVTLTSDSLGTTGDSA